MNFEDKINETLRAMIERGDVDQVIEKHVGNLIEETVRDCLRSYSPFGKALKEHMESQLGIDLTQIGLGHYNDTIVKTINAKLDSLISNEWKSQIEEFTESVIRKAPKEVKLSQIHQMLFDEEQDEWDHDLQDEAATLIKETNKEQGWIDIYLDGRYKEEKRDCSLHFTFSEKGMLCLHQMEESDVYRYTKRKKRKIKDRMYADLYGIERLLFGFRVSKTKIINDLADGEHYLHYRED